MKQRMRKLVVPALTLMMVMTLFLSACGSKSSTDASTAAPTKADNTANVTAAAKDLQKVTIQLKWVPQAQFAGIYVAMAKGYYQQEGLDPVIIPGGPDMVIEQQVMNGAADLGITSVDSLMVNIDHGLPLVSVAQFLQKSSNMLYAKKSSGIDSPEKMKGKKVGTYGGSQQFQEIAFFAKYGLDANKDLSLVKQSFTMDQFLNGDIDVATGAIFNEYLVILESGIKKEDLNVFSFDDAGVGMLEDTLIANHDWLQKNRDLAVKAVRATLKGWQYAIAHQDEATDIVMKAIKPGSSTREHQANMLKEISTLIMPEGYKPEQIGSFNKDAFQRTADIALKYGLVKNPIDVTKVYDQSVQEDAMKSQ